MKEGIFLSSTAIKEVLQFADKVGSFRTGLQGIYINPKDPKKLIIEATDGHRLHRMQTDSSGITSPDTDSTLNTAPEKERFTLQLTEDEKDDLNFRLKEIQALAKLQRKSGFVFVRVKFTKTRIILLLDDYVLVRYIAPANGIPEGLVGMEMGVNIKYFLECLNVFTNTGINIDLVDKLSPIKFKPADSEYPIHVLMPGRLYPMRKRGDK